VVRLQPENYNVYNSLGALLASNNQLDQAAVQFRKAIKLNPEFADAHYNLGRVYVRQKKLDDAVVEFNRAIQNNPNFEKAKTSLTTTLQMIHAGGPTRPSSSPTTARGV